MSDVRFALMPERSSSVFPRSKVAMPEGWPIFEPGLMMAMLDRLLVVHLDARLTPTSFARYRAAWLRAIDARAPQARAGALYAVPTWAGITARMRKDWADMLKSREQTLRATTAGMALVTPSLLVRGALNAVFWLAPPGYPYRVTESLGEGFAFLAQKVPLLDAALCEQQFAELMREYARVVPP
jgi:hypothetical protein